MHSCAAQLRAVCHRRHCHRSLSPVMMEQGGRFQEQTLTAQIEWCKKDQAITRSPVMVMA